MKIIYIYENYIHKNYVYMYIYNHFGVYQKLTQHCKSIELQFKNYAEIKRLKQCLWKCKTTFTRKKQFSSF